MALVEFENEIEMNEGNAKVKIIERRKYSQRFLLVVSLILLILSGLIISYSILLNNRTSLKDASEKAVDKLPYSARVLHEK